MQKSWWSRVVFAGSIVGALALPLGALGTRFGLWQFPIGLLLVAIGTALAAIFLIGGLVALVVARRRGYAADRPLLLRGVIISVIVVAFMSVHFYRADAVPPIHNISTDVQDPPEFVAVPALRGEGTNPLAYDQAELAELQQAAYPDVHTLTLDEPVPAVFNRALAVLESMGLDIVEQDEAAGRIEATATTFWFGFKDDLVVRLRPLAGSAAGTAVDVRSVSRVGRSDLGVNARRIREILKALDAA